MKISSLLVLTTVCFGLSACVTSEVVTNTDIFLRPVHSITMGREGTFGNQAHIVDNDGNLYITYWDRGADDDETFNKNSSACRDQMADQLLFTKYISIVNLSEEQITPSTYVPFIKCIHAFGYNLLDKEGYSPDEFNLIISRSHLSRRSKYLPIGGTFILRKQKARYLDVYQDVVVCEAQARGNKKDAAVEEYDDHFVKVSLKDFAEKIETCLVKKSYSVEEGA